jgi:hypothetical protein
LLLALLRQTRLRCRDELVEMMLRRIRRTEAAAKERLDDLHEQHREIKETLIGVFGQVLKTGVWGAVERKTDVRAGLSASLDTWS